MSNQKYNSGKGHSRINPKRKSEKSGNYREYSLSNDKNIDEGLVIGRNAVRELLKTERAIDKIFVQKGDREGSIVVLVAEAVARHIPLVEVEKAKLDRMTGGANHQGIVAKAAEKEYCSMEDILQIAKDRGERPFIVIADGITDPHNLGAIRERSRMK